MTNSDEKNMPISKEAPQLKRTQKNMAPSKNKSWMTKGAGFIALIALIIASYTFWLNQQLQGRIVETNNELANQINKLEQKQDDSQKQIEQKTAFIEESRNKLQSEFEYISKQMQTALSQRFYQNQNWLLLKARYCLELAQINIHWSTNFDATTALLQQADQLLQQLHSPEIFEIRQAIAKDLAQLQTISLIDVTGILSQLDAAQNSVDKLNIRETLSNNKPPIASDMPPSKTLSLWKLRFQDSMDLLSKLVIIRHHNEPIQPIIAPEVEALLKENIRLNLQEAQWAVLNNNSAIYSMVLNQAIATLKKNFNEQAQNTAVLIKTLTNLQKISLVQQKPTIGLALPLLNQLIEKQPRSNTQGENSL